jgi:glycosyltransferase involved in cell wall biosynthesis
MIKVTHIITGLHTGGAEMMLYKLLSYIDHSLFVSEVISLIDIGPLGPKIQSLGIPVRTLGMKRSSANLRSLLSLKQMVRESTPDIVQTWMYHADLLGGLSTKLAGHMPIIWNIRQSNFDHQKTKRMTLLTIRSCALFSHLIPKKIVTNSKTAASIHVQLGYRARNIVVIPNGFQLDIFKPDKNARLDVRQELGVSADSVLIGLIARFDPLKDHYSFIQAAKLLHSSLPDVHFLLCGDDISWKNEQLAQWIDSTSLRPRFHLLGLRDDIPRLKAALDIATSSSYGEAFPNIVGEAMACGVPCVVTDVGDSALIVGETGLVVSPGNPQELALAWKALINMVIEERSLLGQKARQRIADQYSLTAITKQYEALYQDVIQCVA